MAIQQVSDELVGVDQAGAMTNMSPWTWRRKAYDGTVSSVKIGTRLLIPLSEIRRVISENTRPRRISNEGEVA